MQQLINQLEQIGFRALQWFTMLCIPLPNLSAIDYHYRARNWTSDENKFLVSFPFSNGSSGELKPCEKISGEADINAIKVAWLHWFSAQSCT